MIAAVAWCTWLPWYLPACDWFVKSFLAFYKIACLAVTFSFLIHLVFSRYLTLQSAPFLLSFFITLVLLIFLTLSESDVIAKSLIPKSMPIPPLKSCFNCLQENFKPRIGFIFLAILIPMKSTNFTIEYYSWIGVFPINRDSAFRPALPSLLSDDSCVAVSNTSSFTWVFMNWISCYPDRNWNRHFLASEFRMAVHIVNSQLFTNAAQCASFFGENFT